jgi:hypothetical protein
MLIGAFNLVNDERPYITFVMLAADDGPGLNGTSFRYSNIAVEID